TRHRAEQDLLHNRLPTDHYSILMERLDREMLLGRTRLLESRFPDLPDVVLQRIGHVLADGRLERDEFLHLKSRFAQMGLRAATPTGLEGGLARWLVQDS